LVAGIVALVTVLATRPKNLELTESDAMESLSSLIKAAMIGSGAITIEFTELLDDSSILFYYVAFNGDLNVSTIREETNLGNPSLYLTRSEEPTIEDLLDSESVLRIGVVSETTFPLLLYDSFLPGDFKGVLLVEDGTDQANAGSNEMDAAFTVPFKIVDAKRNIATPTEAPATLDPTPNPTGAPTASPMLTVTGATRAPTEVPTGPPTFAPVSPTNAPVVPPTAAPLPKVLVSTLEGDNYDIEGTITIDYVMSLEGGQAVDLARLRFEVAAVSAPGPYLYLSKRTFSETEGGDLLDTDIAIDIDGVANGAFTMDGRFEQILDEIENVRDLNEYDGGSFIIWCRPFGVWLGGGPIEASD
jgi:hypothetical protein